MRNRIEAEQGVPLKRWFIETAESLGITTSALIHRVYRGRHPYPNVRRVNQRVVLVVEEKPSLILGGSASTSVKSNRLN